MLLKVHKYSIEISLCLTGVNYAIGLLFFFKGDRKDIINKNNKKSDAI